MSKNEFLEKYTRNSFFEAYRGKFKQRDFEGFGKGIAANYYGVVTNISQREDETRQPVTEIEVRVRRKIFGPLTKIFYVYKKDPPPKGFAPGACVYFYAPDAQKASVSFGKPYKKIPVEAAVPSVSAITDRPKATSQSLFLWWIGVAHAPGPAGPPTTVNPDLTMPVGTPARPEPSEPGEITPLEPTVPDEPDPSTPDTGMPDTSPPDSTDPDDGVDWVGDFIDQLCSEEGAPGTDAYGRCVYLQRSSCDEIPDSEACQQVDDIFPPPPVVPEDMPGDTGSY